MLAHSGRAAIYSRFEGWWQGVGVGEEEPTIYALCAIQIHVYFTLYDYHIQRTTNRTTTENGGLTFAKRILLRKGMARKEFKGDRKRKDERQKQHNKRGDGPKQSEGNRVEQEKLHHTNSYIFPVWYYVECEYVFTYTTLLNSDYTCAVHYISVHFLHVHVHLISCDKSVIIIIISGFGI